MRRVGMDQVDILRIGVVIHVVRLSKGIKIASKHPSATVSTNRAH